MKNILKQLIETQIPSYVEMTGRMLFIYEFPDSDVYVNVKRITTKYPIEGADKLIDINTKYPEYEQGDQYIYYILKIKGVMYYISVTTEEDLYFQSVLQKNFKQMQLNDFAKLAELIAPPQKTPEQNLDEVQQETINDK